LLPTRRVLVPTGLYDDMAGSLALFKSLAPDMAAIALEWPDLDRRLGFRHLGGWGPKELSDIVRNVEATLHSVRQFLEPVPADVSIAVSLPTLDLPPVFHTASWQLSDAEVRLRQAVNDFASWAGSKQNLRIANLACTGSHASSFDFKGEILAGLPYSV